MPLCSPEFKCRKDRKKKKKVTNIISFDDEEDEQNLADILTATITSESSEENFDRSSTCVLPPSEGLLAKLTQDRSLLNNDASYLNGDCSFHKLDVKSIDDEDVDESDVIYGKTLGNHSLTENMDTCVK